MSTAPATAFDEASVAEAFLRSLRAHGIDTVFANAGTDFAPIIEALTRLESEPGAAPTILTVPHENLAVAMAHGHYLASGKPAAVMVHVTVGTGNTICALMNAYRDRIPLLLMAGRTPHTEYGHIASRNFPIHWGQENFDQSGMVREYTKWDYELRSGQHPHDIVARALEVALAEPRGPVYLTLPREVLADPCHTPSRVPAATRMAPPAPNQTAVLDAAARIAAASTPVIITSHLGRDKAAVPTLAKLADSYDIPVVQAGASAVNLPASHPMNTGQAGGALLENADCIVVVESEVPWFPVRFTPRPGTCVIHIGIDPLFVRYPIRSFPTELAIAGDPGTTLSALSAALKTMALDEAARQTRRQAVEQFQQDRQQRHAANLEAAREATPISYAYVGECIRRQMPEHTLVVTELGIAADQLGLEEPGSLIGVGIGGGLGFGLGAALGAKLADRSRCVIATVGDGSYMFGNPTPYHFVSRAADLPVLTIICNNRRWNAVDASTRIVYPDGAAAHAKPMPLVELEPSPEFTKVAEASDAFARKVEAPADLPRALDDALEAVAGGRQALLDVRVEHGDRSSG
ncbi:MAG: thiamine pyrophosphate-requiring protein [Gammaproteobacteria bacterium]|jgi:acetolactate synthase-1/2/3 large subunit